MTDAFGAVPRHGWARMVPELHVNDLARRLTFWRDIVGFVIAYQRADGAQVMLCQRHARFETGPMKRRWDRA
jgi:hypothetical protein